MLRDGGLFLQLCASGGADVNRAQLAAVLGVGLGVIGDLLALGERLEAVALDGGKVDKHLAAVGVVGDKAEPLSSLNHFTVPLFMMIPPKKCYSSAKIKATEI